MAWTRRLLHLLAATAAASVLLALPAWSAPSLAAYGVLGLALSRLLGMADAFFAVTLGLALQGMDASSENPFLFVVLPLWAVFAAGALLALTVVRRPSLGRRIEMGPFGPGGA